MTDFVRRLIERTGQFAFDPAAATYSVSASGRVVTTEQVRKVLGLRIDEGKRTKDALLNALTSQDIRVAEWRDNFAVELRRMHIEAFGLGRGGLDQISVADRAIIEARLKDEYAYLRDFAKEIAQGNVSPAEIERRMNMYINHTNATFWQGQAEAQKGAGRSEEMRVLNPAEHCVDCEGLAGHWEPIGDLPEPGDGSVCLSNCACTKVYR